MIPTVVKPLRKKFVSKDQMEKWVNVELIPFLLQVNQALNYVNAVRMTTITAHTGVMTTIWASTDIAVGQSVVVDTTIMGIGTGACAVFKITGTFRNPGVLAQEGATAAPYTQNTPGFAVQYLVVANHIEVQVQDDGVLTVNWEATMGASELQ